ncbi:DUF4144 domain-containing protein [Shewanella profunda]|uniref:DUF4144 domain-containing protein n=1 Tax=Shewanella profunda TaxID=254793 RepID=UPI00200DD397|nr:DUF4144 domain-containing protein [Shewanella profunda]MCL1091581.1 DUF4144 domain-containing protein [Shewanella profunda]
MTSVKMSDIQWPAVVKLIQNDELLYLAHQRDWLELACLYQHHFTDKDQLLDSKGYRYHISANSHTVYEDPIGELPKLLQQEQHLPLTEFIKWVQNHAKALDHCCVAKLAFTTISQGMEIVRTLDE